MLNNCTENGYLFSCFQNIGELQNSAECEKACHAKNLYQFGLNDFYNFFERLNETNYLIYQSEKITDLISEAREIQTCMIKQQ